MAADYHRSRSDASGRVRLEDRMVLLGWLNDLLGYGSASELLSGTKDVPKGFDLEGLSHLCRMLVSRDIPPWFKERLKEYDGNIREYLETVNAGRPERITLKYFQYLAVLYAEIFLDFYFNRRRELLSRLNDWVKRLNEQPAAGRPPYGKFVEKDLKKLAFWMATGSGKTHVMHVNYRQFLRYNTEPLDNILLVTPNERLSAQHLKELDAANIRAGRLRLHARGDPGTDRHRIQVIEITKIRLEKSGGGESIPIDALEGNNLIFVDEGHKGSGGDEWRGVRDALGETGFTFEYSATFRQALAAARNDRLVEAYGRAIAFDYSYPHFHGDGYGKDFDILNLRQEAYEGQTDILLMANLLSFYEQRLIFDEEGDALRPYNLARPLWMFVGSKVNAIYRESGKPRSDVLTVVRFLHRLLADRKWATRLLHRLLEGKSGLEDENGGDILKGKFGYLRGRGAKAAGAYRDILKRVFHANSSGGLRLCSIRGTDGELGLKAAGSGDYFGLVYVGDKSAFNRLVKSRDGGIALESDAISGSLFAGINGSKSAVEILVGSKKFMEGWNSWRVSSMGLLNVGRSEGAQIIQLFGRGVRLRGMNMSLKRSSELDGAHPDHVRLLETLNVFALRADYMNMFRRYLAEEGVRGAAKFQLPIRPNRHLLGRGLVVPRLQEGAAFVEEADMVLGVEQSVRVRVDLLPKVDRVVSGSGNITEASTASSGGRRIPESSLALVDMQDIYVSLLRNKEARQWHNMAICPDAPAEILWNAEYEIVAEDSVLEPRSWADARRLQEAAAAVASKYAERFYRMRRERWEHGRLRYRTLDQNDPNFQGYSVTVPNDEKDIVREVRDIVEECDRIYREETDAIPNIHFERHLYLPLLCEPGGSMKISPPGLNKGERRFVEDLKAYCTDQRDLALAGREIFLLRNQSRGRGVGFFQTHGFYPDFILWVKSGDAQRIVFVEPHGMLQDGHPDYNNRIRLHSKLCDLAENLGMAGVTMDSYIVSQTPHTELARQYGAEWNSERFDEHHILFPEIGKKYDYLAKIILGAEPRRDA